MQMLQKLIFLITLLIIVYSNIKAQNTQQIQISFRPVYLDRTLTIDLESDIKLYSTDVVIDLFRCYISNLEFVNKKNRVFYEKDSYHLLDAEKLETLSFSLEVKKEILYDSIRFMIGIDSLTSISGAMGGDLDPTKGMFWTWNTGYIFFKLEGESPICETHKNRFVYHLGGYDGLYAAQQLVTLPVTNNNDINIMIDLDYYMQKIDLIVQPNLMRSGNSAFKYSQYASSIFKIIK